MAEVGGSGEVIVERGRILKHPSLTTKWLRDAVSAGRSAFEREMRRERRGLDAEFDRFWRERSARQA
ncbi:MAG: hypothetical protein ACE5JR_11380 [Gemmatimonadota bacterium]